MGLSKTHSICRECYIATAKKNPESIPGSYKETCCRCGKEHSDALYCKSVDYEKLVCKGKC